MKKKIYTVLGFVSIIVCVYGLFKYRVWSWLLFLVLGLYLIFNDKIKVFLATPAPAAISDTPKVENKPQLPRGFNCFSVVGVKFKNEDGSDRQRYLRKIYFEDKPFDGDLVVTLERYLWKGDPAYYVKVNGFIVGNIEADMVYYFEENAGRECDMWIDVNCSKSRVFYAEISGRFKDCV